MALFNKTEKPVYEELVLEDEEMETPAVNTYEREPERVREVAPQPTVDTAIITKNTKIVGDVITDGNLVVDGVVEGNLTSSGDLVVTGTVLGDISSKNLYIEGCDIQSNVTATGCVIIKEDARIDGKLVCQDVTVMGGVNGDIDATGSVFVKSTAFIKGDVVAASIGVENGAKIDGKYQIR